MTRGSLGHFVRSEVPEVEQHGTLAGEGMLAVDYLSLPLDKYDARVGWIEIPALLCQSSASLRGSFMRFPTVYAHGQHFAVKALAP